VIGDGNIAPVRAAHRARTHTTAQDAGFVGGVEVLPFGLLIFVVGTLLVANIWAVIDARFAVDAAAREAARYYVEADVVDPGGQAHAEAGAIEAGLAALEAHGRDRSRADLQLANLTGGAGGEFVRCARVSFAASYEVPALTLPWIGGFGSGFQVSGRHSELIDPYRDGVPGDTSGC
jgi:hypothetical protein